MNRQSLSKKLDNYKRKFFCRLEIKKLIYKNIKSKNIQVIEKQIIKFKKSKMPIKSIKTRFNNKCTMSGRNHNVLNKFRLSRFFLRSELKKNDLSIIKKF